MAGSERIRLFSLDIDVTALRATDGCEQFGELCTLFLRQRWRFGKNLLDVIGDLGFGELTSPLFDLFGIVAVRDTESITRIECT